MKKIEKNIWTKNKQEVLSSSKTEKDSLHAEMVQREQLKTLIELNTTVKNLTDVLKEFENHQFMTIHRSKLKIALYNLSLGMLFAIGTVLWLLLLSWSTYHFFKDSAEIKWFIDSQLKMRQFNVQDIKEKVKSEIKQDPDISNMFSNANSWTNSK